jgi:GT2 family glycosyltransferase
VSEVRESRAGSAILRYRAWLEKQRGIGAGWFKVYDSVTSLIVQYVRRPAVTIETPAPLAEPPPRIHLQSVNPEDAAKWKGAFKQLNRGISARAPKISILTPAWNTEPGWFVDAALSVLNQTESNWEWVVVDDASSNRAYFPLASALLEVCPRFRLERLEQNQGISGATNAALRLAHGEYVCMLDHDDILHPRALEDCLAALESNHLDAVYTDSDKVSEDGTLVEPFFKPDWSPEYFRGVMYVGHLLCVRRLLAESIGGFDSAYNGIQDFEFFLRYSEQGSRIGHIPKILYHWRRTEGSIAAAPDAKGSRIVELQSKAVQKQLSRLKLPARALAGSHAHRVSIAPEPRGATAAHPRVTIVIPTRDAPEVLGTCLDSIRSRSTYSNLQILCADNDTSDPIALSKMQEPGVDRIACPGPFNYSRINNNAIRERAEGDFIVLLNNDIEVITPSWIEEMLYYAEQPRVGAVGAMLLYPNGSIQHAGVALGFRGTADHILRGANPDSDGYAGSLCSAREVSAVTGACLMVKRSLYDAIGGLNEFYRTLYQDVDFCLRLREKGLRNIFVPRARLYHHESYTRKDHYDMLDRALMLDCWESHIDSDPYFNPNFSREHVDYQLAKNADRGV